MKHSDALRENADNCLQIADEKPDHPSIRRYTRMAEGWLALAHEQDWLDGEVPPQPPESTGG